MHWWFGNKSQSQNEKHSSASSRRGRRFGRISRRMLSLVVLFFIYVTYFGTKIHFHGEWYSQSWEVDNCPDNNVNQYSWPLLTLSLVYTFEVTVLSLEDVEEESKVNSVEEQLKKPSDNVTEQPRKPHRQRKNIAIDLFNHSSMIWRSTCYENLVGLFN